MAVVNLHCSGTPPFPCFHPLSVSFKIAEVQPAILIKKVLLSKKIYIYILNEQRALLFHLNDLPG